MFGGYSTIRKCVVECGARQFRQVFHVERGVYDTKKVQDAIHSAFDTWTAGAPPTSNVPVVPKERRIVLVDRPKSEQSSVWLGLAAPDPSNVDWVRMRVTDALLGGSFGSRITANIREDKGYTYSPYSFISVQKKHALWIEAADITTAVTGPAIAEILKKIDRPQTETAPQEELRRIEASLAGRFIIQNSSRMGVINQLETVDHHELDESFLSTYVNKVMTVSGEDVKATAQKFIQPAKLFIVIVGDKKLVEPQWIKLNLNSSS